MCGLAGFVETRGGIQLSELEAGQTAWPMHCGIAVPTIKASGPTPKLESRWGTGAFQFSIFRQPATSQCFLPADVS